MQRTVMAVLAVLTGCASEPVRPVTVDNEITLGELKGDAREDCAESEGRDACACEWARRGTRVPSDLYGKSWCDWLKEEDSQ